ncbi:MAG: hypothetical protein OEN55_13130 [Alphaproteobacteria bacterium]|nr:hypothetical protein [Alphaproteobacteria bacterium]
MTPEPDLPRWGIVLLTWRILIENSGAALRNAVLPFLILLAMHRLTGIVAPAGFHLIGWQMLHVAVFPIPAALLLVPWYRRILSAQRPELANRPARWWYVAFMIRTLLLELMLFASQIPSMVASVMAVESGGAPDPELARLALMFFLVALAPGFYLYGRAGLSLPAAACGDDDGYVRSWRMSGGAGWRIAGIVIVVWFPFFIISGMVSGVPAEGTAPAPPAFLDAAMSAAIDVVRELAMAAALGLVYLHYSAPRGN